MDFFNELRNIMVVFTIIKMVHENRNKILDFSLKNKFLRYPVGFMILPYIIYILFKLANDEFIIRLLVEGKRQKRLDEFL